MHANHRPRSQPPSSFFNRALPPTMQDLADLAIDLRWSGSAAANRLWAQLDPEIWAETENPYVLLQEVSQDRLDQAAQDPVFLEKLRYACDERQRALRSTSWYEKRSAAKDQFSVAYFSMEFGLGEALPVYSGGLGLLAGDHLKTASDMGVPITGVGLLYQQGYFRQVLTCDGWQLEAMPYNDPSFLPVTPVRSPDGGWLRITLHLPGRVLILRVWQGLVGRVTLYLLDSNDPLNSPWDRAITASLYPAQPERRFLQELVLGGGGWRLLETLGIEPDVCHLNEGHPAFAVLARISGFMRKTGCSFQEARWATRAGNVFTTHTAVPAGFDRFDPGMVRQYTERFAANAGISVEDVLDLGRTQSGDGAEQLNIAVMAMRTCGRVNAVSRLHGEVSRAIFSRIYPRWPIRQVPVMHVTNGVHVPSWHSEAAENLWRSVVKSDPWTGEHGAAKTVEEVPADRLWAYRSEARKALVDYVRARLVKQACEHAANPDATADASNALRPDALTLGFARRMEEYKRPALLLADEERLVRLLTDRDRPVQIVMAGKAHPNSGEGKQIIHRLAAFASRPDICDRFVFLEDYDIALNRHLTAGVDVWLNTPRRPWEASGTSGMKVLVNGGLNLSELDGWWAEAFSPEVGWAIGDGRTHVEPGWDAEEARQLYEALERSVVPEFYTRDTAGLPQAWLARVRASMARLTPQFSTHRMLREYVEQLYEPAAAAYRKRTENDAAIARELADWQADIERYWRDLRFGDVALSEERKNIVYSVAVYFGRLNPAFVRVELYAEPPSGESAGVVVPMDCAQQITDTGYAALFTAIVPRSRPAGDYTARIVPYHPDALIPVEDTHILWQR